VLKLDKVMTAPTCYMDYSAELWQTIEIAYMHLRGHMYSAFAGEELKMVGTGAQ